MVGGLLNIITAGAENIILIGNPNKTFFIASSILDAPGVLPMSWPSVIADACH